MSLVEFKKIHTKVYIFASDEPIKPDEALFDKCSELLKDGYKIFFEDPRAAWFCTDTHELSASFDTMLEML